MSRAMAEALPGFEHVYALDLTTRWRDVGVGQHTRPGEGMADGLAVVLGQPGGIVWIGEVFHRRLWAVGLGEKALKVALAIEVAKSFGEGDCADLRQILGVRGVGAANDNLGHGLKRFPELV